METLEMRHESSVILYAIGNKHQRSVLSVYLDIYRQIKKCF